MNLVEQMFGFLEPAYIPNGLLFPAALPLERTYEFNGRQLPHDGRRLTPKRFGNLLFTLQSAQRDTSKPALFDNDYVAHYRETAATETVYVGGVLAAGGNVQNDALANGWILVSSDSSALYDGPTGGVHTYRTDTVFAFTPLVERFAGTSVTYQFDAAYFYGNQIWPSQLEFDPGDGFGFRAVGFGDSLSVDYSGFDTVRMELRFAVGSQNMRAYAMGIVPPAARRMGGEGFPMCFTDVPGVSIEFQPADTSCQESWFANSLIVVDGIDPGNSLIDGSQAVTFDDAYRKYSEYFISLNNSVADEIIAKGYDFVFINFDDGGQSVQSTAQILKAAIHWINGRKFKEMCRAQILF